MATMSTKYVPIKLQQHSVRPVVGTRVSTFPERMYTDVQKSSVVFAERNAGTDPDYLMHSTKELHYDDYGVEFMKYDAVRAENRASDKEYVKTLTKDLRGVHYELGTNIDTHVSSHKQDYVAPSRKTLEDNKNDIISNGSGKTLGIKTNVYPEVRDINAWRDAALVTTSQREFKDPKELDDGTSSSFPNSTAAEKKRIIKEMRTSHFYFGDSNDPLETTTASAHTLKHLETKKVLDTAQLNLGSNIVLGRSDPDTQKDLLRSTYGHQICDNTKSYNHSKESKRAELENRKQLRQMMCETSVKLGADNTDYITHYDSEFRHVIYEKNGDR